MEFCEEFHADTVILWEHISCKALDGMHGQFEEKAREKGIHLIWVQHDLFDPRIISRQEIRDQVNRYMRSVLREEPLDPTLKDSKVNNYSKSYLRHLFKAEEFLGQRLLTYQNLAYVKHLMGEIREAIKNDRLLDYLEEMKQNTNYFKK